MKALRKIADVLAVVFHPVFLFFYAILFSTLIFGLPGFDREKILLLATALVFTVLVPLAATYITTRDFHLPERKQRQIPLTVTIISYFCTALIIYKLFGKEYELPLLIAVGLTGVLFLNMYLKISLHAFGYGIVFGGIVASLNDISAISLPFLISIMVFSVLAGLILWQRIHSKSHTSGEVVLGFFVGMISVLLFSGSL
jgi:hypothetical protein